MNDPYPSNRTLCEESIAEDLVNDQETAASEFRRVLGVFTAAFDRIHFPLGSPVAGYDLEDISGTISDWRVMREDYAEAAAAEAAIDDDVDNRRDLANDDAREAANDDGNFRGLEA